MHGRQDLANGNELLFIERFSNKNNFDAELHEGGIAGVGQYDNDQDIDIENVNRNTNEDLDTPLGIALDPTSDCGEILGVPP